MSNENIRILIIDDHAIVREGLRGFISTEPGMEVVAEAATGDEGILKALSLKPDVILMDLVMPGKSGAQAIVEIKHNWPEAHILVLTSFIEDDKLFPAIEGGALGYLLKDTKPEELLDAIRSVHSGQTTLHPSIAQKVLKRLQEYSAEAQTAPPELTERELEVLRHLAQGIGDREISQKLEISEKTVSFHVGNILSKLHLANRTQAALYALRKGLANLEHD
jgi:two-component system, NarL family, response regulator LiaR